MTIGDRIRDLRQQRGMTQAQVARLANGTLRERRINDIERNRRRSVTLFTLHQLARGLGVTLMELMEGVTE